MAKKEEVSEITKDKKEQLLNEALKAIEKQYGKGSIRKVRTNNDKKHIVDVVFYSGDHEAR